MKYAVIGESSGARSFVEQDPFALEGLVKSYKIREWNDSLLS